jgi:acyl carrier protein
VIETFAAFASEARGEIAGDATSIEDALADAAPSARLDLVRRFVKAQVARAMGQPAETIDASASLARLGLDSLAAVELRDRVEIALGVALPKTIDAQSPTVTALAEALLASWLRARVAGSEAQANTDVEEELTF